MSASPPTVRSRRRRLLVAALTGAAVVAATALTTSGAMALPADKPSPGVKAAAPGLGNGGGIPWADLADPNAAAAPGVVVDTMVPDVQGTGRPGVRVGPSYYTAPYLGTANGQGTYAIPASGRVAAQQSRWQVVALSQQNLRPKWNRTYSNDLVVDSASPTAKAGSLANDLQSLQNDPVPSIVVLTSHDTNGWAGFDPGLKQVTDAFAALDVTLATASREAAGATGGFSLVAKINGHTVAPQYKWSGVHHQGRMTGLLVIDQYLDYRFVANERPTIDTRSVNGCDAPRTNCEVAVTVADATHPDLASFQSQDTGGGAGFLVVVYDKLTLAVLERNTYFTNGPTSTAHAAAMAQYLSGLKTSHPGDLVVVTSVRSPGSRDIVVDHAVPYATMLALSQAVAAVGGTRDTFNKAVGGTGVDYGLVGWTDPDPAAVMEGAGSETSGPDARMRAVLRRDQHSLFRPVNGSGEMAPDDELANLAWATPTATWPALDGDVIAYLQGAPSVQANTTPLSADPRRQYWTDSTLETGGADQLAAAVDAVPAPASYTGLAFTADQFTQTKGQLYRELVAVSHVRATLDTLAAPFRTVKGDYANRVNAIVDTIYTDTRDKKEAEFDWEGLLSALVSIVGALGPGALVKFLGVAKATAEKLAHALHAAAGLVEASAWGASHSKDGPPAYDDFSLKRDEIAAYIGANLDASIANLSILGDLVVADYDKLMTVGDWCHATAKPEGVCGASDQSWQSLAVATMKRSNDRTVWTQVSPLSYAAYDLGATLYPLSNPTDYLEQYLCSGWAALKEAPASAIANPRQGDYVPTYLKIDDDALTVRTPDPRTQSWTLWPTVQTYILGLKEKNSPQWAGSYAEYPDTTKVLDRMFGPVLADNNVDNGGLGISPEQFIPTLPHNFSNGCYWVGQVDFPWTPTVPPGTP